MKAALASGQSGRFAFMKWLFMGLVLLLAGCATQTPEVPLGSGKDFVRNGRFALKVEEFNRDPQAVQGGFTWHDAQNRLSLDLTNPFGTILARVLVEDSGSVLTRSNGEVVRASTPDELVQLVLGQSIPVQGLRQWLRLTMQAVPGVSGLTIISTDQDGRVLAFEQSGWRVDRSRFDGQGPRLLVLLRSEQGKTISLRLVIDTP